MRLERMLGECLRRPNGWPSSAACKSSLAAHENGQDGAGELVRRHARDGARRQHRAAAGRPVRADLHASAQAGCGAVRSRVAASRLVGETRVRPGQPMTKEKRMEPPRLSLVPSSQESNDNAPRRRGRRAGARRRPAAQRRRAAVCRPSREAAHPGSAAVRRLRAARRGKARQPPRRGEDIADAASRSCGRSTPAAASISCKVAGKWAFRTAEDLSYLLERYATQERRLSKAALETLSIIAYHQPVTRAEIEEIRGVTTSAGTLDMLMETGWVRLRGRRRAPGRPVTYGTTEAFLSHFGLEGIKDLPGLAELRASGLLDGNLPPDFTVPDPTDACRPDARRAAARSRRGRGRGGRWTTARTATETRRADGEALPGDEDPDKP